jgi:HK97 family phage prohead protease
MSIMKLIEPLLDKAMRLESQRSYLKGLHRPSREFEIRFSQGISELDCLLEMEINRGSHLMLKEMKTLLPPVLDRVTHPHAEFKGMGNIERKSFFGEIKNVDDDRMIIEAFVSTERPDRMGDIMRADGMQIDGRPTVLFAHGMGPPGQEPIGRPLSISKDEYQGYKGIKARIEFYPDEIGKRLYDKVKKGFIHGFSVGFIPNKWKPLRDGRDITDWTLLEMSLVGVPANPDATAIESGSFEGFQFKMLPREISSGKIGDRQTITRIVKELVEEAVHAEFQKLRE